MNVSIIIPTRNRYDTLIKCVKSLCELGRYDASDELIIVDNSDIADPGVQSQIKMIAEGRIRLRYEDVSGQFLYNLGKMRNYGLRRASGEIVVLMDDDSFIREENWKETAEKIFNDGAIAGITGAIEEPNKPIKLNDNPRTGKFTEEGECIGEFFNRPSRLTDIDHMRGCFMIFRRSALEKTGLFDEQITGPYFNETELCLRVRKAGFRIVMSPDINVDHRMVKRINTTSRNEEDLKCAFYKIRNTYYVFWKYYLPNFRPFFKHIYRFYWNCLYSVVRRKRLVFFVHMVLFPVAAVAGLLMFIRYKSRTILNFN